MTGDPVIYLFLNTSLLIYPILIYNPNDMCQPTPNTSDNC